MADLLRVAAGAVPRRCPLPPTTTPREEVMRTGDGILIRPVTGSDAEGITRIFNHYVRRSFSAFPEREVDPGFMAGLLEGARSFGCYAVETGGEVIGFGVVRPLYPFPNLMTAGEVSYFLCPGFTGRGTGTRLLGVLEERARELGMTSLVARVSSRNRRSIRFHTRNGFSPCGRIRAIGTKFGKPFDVVILQKFL